MQIEGELNAAKDAIHKTMESLLERGEKLDDLVAKSDGLSAQSKMFYSKWPSVGSRSRKASMLMALICSTSEEAEFVLRGYVDVLGLTGLYGYCSIRLFGIAVL